MLNIKLKLTALAALWLQIFCPQTHPRRGQKFKLYIFSESSQIKGNLAQSTMKANMLSLHTPTTTGWGQKVIFFFSKSGHVAYQIKVEEV